MNLPGKWRRRLRLLRSATRAALPAPCARRPGELRFQCGVCTAGNVIEFAGLTREGGSCRACGSTVRFRAVIAALSQGLYGEHRPLRRFVADKSVRGIGMSDWVGRADRLERLFDYTNTSYDTEPRLDITAVPLEMAGTLDLIRSSDVFAHVAQPVVSAFENARRLLNPGSLLGKWAAGSLTYPQPRVQETASVRGPPNRGAMHLLNRTALFKPARPSHTIAIP